MKRVLFFVLWSIGLMILAFSLGAFAVRDVQPRTPIRLTDCSAAACISTKELAGLLGSIGMQHLPQVLPGIDIETGKTVAMRHPFPYAPVHFVIIPKRDIKNPGDIAEGDQAYIVDAFAVISELVKKHNLQKYRVIANGPGYQSVSYVHFHLLGKE